jgi:hypothetical protein
MSGVDLGALVSARIQYVIQAALDAMPEDVKAERVAWCQERDQHGVTVYRSEAGVDLQWAGQRLAFIDADALTEDSLLFRGIDGDEVDPS